jgi:hypothetical protein
VKEQSHKDEMSAALRGDFERLRERGVTPTLLPGETETVEGELEVDVDAAIEVEPEPEPESPPGWLSRLFGR